MNWIRQLWSRSLICSSRGWLQTELDDTKSCYQLIKTMTNLWKKLDIDFTFSLKKRKEKKQLTWQNATQQHMQMMYSVHLHWHDVLTFSLTVLLHCPIRSMMCDDSILLVLKSGWWSPIMFENFIVLIDIEMLACVGGWKKFGSLSALVEYFKQLNMLYVGVSY